MRRWCGVAGLNVGGVAMTDVAAAIVARNVVTGRSAVTIRPVCSLSVALRYILRLHLSSAYKQLF